MFWQALAKRRQLSVDSPVEAIIRPYPSRLSLSQPPNAGAERRQKAGEASF
jgi:hypothetical protein